MSDDLPKYANFPYASAVKGEEPRTHHPLPAALGATVPFAIHKLIQQDGPHDWQRENARAYADTLASQGDVLMYGGEKGEAAKLFAGLAEAIAVLAFTPGGINVFGTHYEAHNRAWSLAKERDGKGASHE